MVASETAFYFLPFPAPLPACDVSNKPSLLPCSSFPPSHRDPTHLTTPAPPPDVGFKPLLVLALFLPLLLLDFTFSQLSSLPSVACLQVLKTFLAVLLPLGSSLSLSACLPFHCLQPCMHVRFRGCVVIPIVLPYYS
jgi:hypothetical protein